MRVKQEYFLPKYCSLLLNSELILIQAKINSNGIGVPDLGLTEISKFSIPIPSISEQKQIYDFLQKEIKNIDDIISKSQSQIKMLQEKRQALITSAVTGKIDVRNGVAA